MLCIKNITKEYRTGDLVQKALGGVSLNLRDNEFVAILGPSGSGKTTLLNIIGGLDRYDSGDLVINDISTKKYTDRDWDSYRNHTIGFVFQSYNLIPHQTVLANVELALTISGVSHAEKRRRAVEALTKVGLGDQLHKKPNQMSGGQMQRVAIARALVNDPDILLADEPTGALDTQTSIQVMELIKEVAKDRLVVMVTHNPELAEQYATRTVMLKDGQIISDSDPYDPDSSPKAPEHRNMGRASMSLLTALSLSFNNLWTKRGRTVLTAFAGSIGIIGIALILSLSNGVNAYIGSIEQNALSEYPLSITKSALDYSSALENMGGGGGKKDDAESESPEGDVKEQHTASTLFSGSKTNDLASFKKYLDASEEIGNYAKSVEYSYGAVPRIYRLDDKGCYQVHPDTTLDSLGVSYGSFSSFIMMDSNIFFSLPKEKSLYESQYEVLEGRWPKDSSECILVLNSKDRITDMVLYSLGLKDISILNDMIDKYNSGEEVPTETITGHYKYTDFMGIEFKLVDVAELYEYDTTYGAYVDRSENKEFLRKTAENGRTLTIVGVACPAEDASAAMLSYGVALHSDLADEVMQRAAESQIVKDQLANPEINVFTGKPFGEESGGGIDLSELFKIDEDALSKAFSFNTKALKLDLSGLKNIDFSSLDIDLSQIDISALSQIDMAEIFRGVRLDVSTEQLGGLVQDLLDAYNETGAASPANPVAYIRGFSEFVTSDAGRECISKSLEGILNGDNLEGSVIGAVKKLTDQAAAVVKAQLAEMMGSVASQMTDLISEEISKAMSDMMSQMKKAFNFDFDALKEAVSSGMDPEALQSLMVSMSMGGASYEKNLSTLNYIDKDCPESINIYPKDFESKTHIAEMIEAYNKAAEEKGEDDKKIVYTDYVAGLMSSVTTIVDTVSYVLVAFVAISLIVSSIMIGIITYISVLERTKEIGILRAIGASKRNVSQVFNAETLIIGFLAGALGIGVTLLLLIPGNAVIHAATGNLAVNAYLPFVSAVILICISVVLTLIGGLIPSKAAAKKDPVAALRSE